MVGHERAPRVPIERHTLGNGLRVVLSRDDRVPMVAVNLWYDVAPKDERPGKTGLAHLFEHLMFQGSLNVGKGEHFRYVESAGGTLDASTDLDRTNYWDALPSHELDLALWLEAERMANLLPALTQAKLDTERDVVKNERRETVDNLPYGTWDERLFALVYPPDHPYHHTVIGSMEDLAGASLDDVTEFFSTYYCPNNAVLSIVGDFDPDLALGLVDRHFGPIPDNPHLRSRPDMTLDPIAIGSGAREVVADNVPLPRVYLAYRIPPFGTASFDAAEVSADLLATGRASRMYARLLRTEQLAQDVTSYAFPLIGGAAMLVGFATARPGVDATRLEAALRAEMEHLRDDGPGDGELERVRNLQAAGIAASLERITERADRLSMYTCLFDAPERIHHETERYAAVDAQAVRDLLGTYVRADNEVVLTYLPA